MAKTYINQKEAAGVLSITPETLRSWTKSGKIKSIKRSGVSLYDQKEVEDLKETLLKAKKVVSETMPKPKQETTAEVKKQTEEAKREPEEEVNLNELLSFSLTDEDKARRHVANEAFKILEQEPPKSWLKALENEVRADGTPVLDLPIEKVEFLLSYIFGGWESEILEVKQVFKTSAVVTVRLHFTDLNGIKRFSDGVGSVFVEDEKNVQKELPRAEALARKNAAKKLGKIFGRDINRNVTEIKITSKESILILDWKKKINSCKDWAELESYKDQVTKIGNKELNELYQEREFKLN